MENKKKIKKDLIDVKTKKNTHRKKENLEKNTSSNPTSKFEKKHGCTHNALGDGHEPGAIPGTGI